MIGQQYDTVRGWCVDDVKRRQLGARKAGNGFSWMIPRSKLSEYEPKFRVAGELAEVLSWVRARRVARDFHASQLADARAAVIAASREVVDQEGSQESILALRRAILRHGKVEALDQVVREVEEEAGRAIAAADCAVEYDGGDAA